MEIIQELDPENPSNTFQIAFTLSKLEIFGEAIQIFEKMLEKYPSEYAIMIMLSRVDKEIYSFIKVCEISKRQISIRLWRRLGEKKHHKQKSFGYSKV